jgi:uncharacterized RDD family membrane protein YckC
MENKYTTFWPRFFAGIIDSLIFFPLVFPGLFWDMTSVRTNIIINIANLVIYTIYVVVGHGIYGVTIGKKLLRIKLLDLSETSTIGMGRAFLRESIWVALSVLAIVDFATKTKGTQFITLEQYDELSFYSWISFGWLFLEIATMLTNSKRRAIHDYIARSVVVHVPR